jgi:hypothetical protein
MTKSVIRKAAAVVVAVAILASSTVAMAQGTLRRLPPGQTHTYTAYVVAGVPATVAIRSDGHTDFDLFVYDRFGQLVGIEDHDTDCCVVRWIPRSSGMVTIRVVNVGWGYNNYVIERWPDTKQPSISPEARSPASTLSSGEPACGP